MIAEYSLEIPASPEVLFALTQDYSRRLSWDPFLQSAELLNGALAAAVGVRAYCVADNGWGMETEYVTFNPPRTCAVKMTKGPWFFAEFAGAWRFERLDEDRTRVVFRYSLIAAPRYFRWLLTPLIGRKFATETRKRLLALRTAVEHSRNSIRENSA